MRFRACIAFLFLLSACATTEPSPREPEALNPRIANLQRAAELPWKDEGRCVVEEASQPWPVVVDRCFQALDQERIRFNDPTGRCAVASAGAAGMGLGICVLAAPEIVVGAVIVTGVVVVGFAIKEALDAYELEMGEPEVRPAPETRPVPETKPVPDTKLAPREPQKKRKPKTEPEGGPDFPKMKLGELQREARLAKECGYDFFVGVRSEAHKTALLFADPTLKVVVMDWC
ncbi:DUF6310 domain-containing protein [Archangium violaceum]|uniref:DUF6310 domain-containing protein n=1 Tax=Archangium violaceum TaxID=83451 RepID=UPI002B309BB5|nr:DUF6310 domain-containing protein [Archangium gephyra]